MKFKIGDIVRVRKLKRGVNYYMQDRSASNTATEEMVRAAGKVFTIRAYIGCTAAAQYRLNGINWNWTDEMLDPVAQHISRPKELPYQNTK